METTLKCKQNGPGEVSFIFDRVDFEANKAGVIKTQILISVDGYELRASCNLMGYSLSEFIKGLTALNEKLEGKATLEDFGTEIQMNFTVFGRKKGLLRVDGQFISPFFKDSSENNFNTVLDKLTEHNVNEFGPYGTKILFGGLVVELSQIPDLIKALTAFLKDSSVSITNPL